MQKYYYLDPSNQQQGPVEASDLPKYGVTLNTMVWCEGMSVWQKAGTIPELSAFLGSDSSVPPSPAATAYTPGIQKPDNLLVWSILSTILCCLPLGVVAIVFSSKVDSLWIAGDHAGAYNAAKNAKLFCILSSGLGIAVIILYFIFGVIGVLSSSVW